MAYLECDACDRQWSQHRDDAVLEGDYVGGESTCRFSLYMCTYTDLLCQAFEALIDMRVFVPVAAPSASVGTTFVKYRCAIEKYDIKNAVNVDGQVALKKWMAKTTL